MTEPDRFRTVVDAPKSRLSINHTHTILSLGSCFAETVGGLLHENLFKACVNPFGIVFNPASIAAGLRRLASERMYTNEDLFFADGQWRSWDHHGSFSAASVEACRNRINASFEQGCKALRTCDILMLTLGTAFAYVHTQTGAVVANCHKQPATLFTRRLLSIEEIAAQLKESLERLFASRPDCMCIATVSPVRHLRNCAHDNLVSKSTLVCALHKLEEAFPQLYYFPAYEIMMDELRDYRFYDRDMAHPASVAIDYLWERFVAACVEARSARFIAEWEPLRKAMNHVVSETAGGATREFARMQLDRLRAIGAKYPEVNLAPAVEYFTGLASN
jgi:hypothetical protein